MLSVRSRACLDMISLRAGSLARRETRGRVVGEKGKESLHASYCSSNSAPKTRGARRVKSYQRTPEMSDKLT